MLMMDHLLSFFFYLFASAALVSAMMVILCVNPIYSALFLILVFFNTALLVLLLDLEFLALIFVLIYIGAVMVLFLFILMMLDIKQVVLYLKTYYHFFISGLCLVLLSSTTLYALSQDFVSIPMKDSKNYLNWFNLVMESSTISALGGCLYTQFSFFFIMAGVILLIAMLGAISLTLEVSDVGKKQQVLHKQLNMKPRESLFYVK